MRKKPNDKPSKNPPSIHSPTNQCPTGKTGSTYPCLGNWSFQQDDYTIPCKKRQEFRVNWYKAFGCFCFITTRSSSSTTIVRGGIAIVMKGQQCGIILVCQARHEKSKEHGHCFGNVTPCRKVNSSLFVYVFAFSWLCGNAKDRRLGEIFTKANRRDFPIVR
jgi:hypothetical protein